MKLTISDAARYTALIASMAISYSVERALALSHGVPPAVAFAVPLAIDMYMIWAVRARRDVVFSVIIAVLANTAGVLTPDALHESGTWVSAALHAVFPISVWRMHRHYVPAEQPTAAATVDIPAAAADSEPEPVETPVEPRVKPVEPAAEPPATDPRVLAAMYRKRGMSARAAAPLIGKSHTWVAGQYRELAKVEAGV